MTLTRSRPKAEPLAELHAALNTTVTAQAERERAYREDHDTTELEARLRELEPQGVDPERVLSGARGFSSAEAERVYTDLLRRRRPDREAEQAIEDGRREVARLRAELHRAVRAGVRGARSESRLEALRDLLSTRPTTSSTRSKLTAHRSSVSTASCSRLSTSGASSLACTRSPTRSVSSADATHRQQLDACRSAGRAWSRSKQRDHDRREAWDRLSAPPRRERGSMEARSTPSANGRSAPQRAAGRRAPRQRDA